MRTEEEINAKISELEKKAEELECKIDPESRFRWRLLMKSAAALSWVLGSTEQRGDNHGSKTDVVADSADADRDDASSLWW